MNWFESSSSVLYFIKKIYVLILTEVAWITSPIKVNPDQVTFLLPQSSLTNTPSRNSRGVVELISVSSSKARHTNIPSLLRWSLGCGRCSYWLFSLEFSKVHIEYGLYGHCSCSLVTDTISLYWAESRPVWEPADVTRRSPRGQKGEFHFAILPLCKPCYR